MSLKQGLRVVLMMALPIAAEATASTSYNLELVNAGAMPLSPAVVYISNSALPEESLGSPATPGLIALCQTGNAQARADELSQRKGIQVVQVVGGPILPGQRRSLEVSVKSPNKQTVHIESMYGRSKDVCAVASINSHYLVALKKHLTLEVVDRDNVIQTGAFDDPKISHKSESEVALELCKDKSSAVACLRELSVPSMSPGGVRVFNSYLPSVISFLESHYGASEVLGLGIPQSGGLQLRVTLNH
jgi:hypothetical protein